MKMLIYHWKGTLDAEGVTRKGLLAALQKPSLGLHALSRLRVQSGLASSAMLLSTQRKQVCVCLCVCIQRPEVVEWRLRILQVMQSMSKITKTIYLP